MIYVLTNQGQPLMPTSRYGHVRRLLKQHKATIVQTNPFTIQLCYDVTAYVQPVILGIDPGRTNIGLCAITNNSTPVFTAECRTRNKDIPKLMVKRAEYRRRHRQLKRRMKRRRRAKAVQTTCKTGTIERMLPGYKKPVVCHDIKNKQARFSNRRRPDKWLTSTARQLVQTHVNLVKKLMTFLPVSQIVLEANRFAFMRLDDPSISDKEFQNGPLKEFEKDVKLAVWSLQKGTCLLCGMPITVYHHVRAKHEDGSESIKNRVGLCDSCHNAVHTDPKTARRLSQVNQGFRKKYAALSVLNQAVPFIAQALSEYTQVVLTTGIATKQTRDMYGIPKTHGMDAYAIALSTMDEPDIVLPDVCYRIQQFRRHDRQACLKEMVTRQYCLDSKTVAVNRRRSFEQTKDSLVDYVKNGGRTDNLTVKHPKPVYKDKQRPMPGSRLFYNGKSRILLGCRNHYYEFDDGIRTTSKKRIVLQQRHVGLRFVSKIIQ